MNKTKSYKIIITALALFAAAFIPPAAMAGEPKWQNVPETIMTRPGTAQKGNFLFATAAAGAENIRADKAHEIARKKSFLRALQMIRIASSCKDLIADFKPEQQLQFIQIFAPFAIDAHIKGIRVIRQWEKSRIHYTTVAAPLAEVNNICGCLKKMLEQKTAPPAPEYVQAVTLFNQAKTDEEIGRVIDLLLLACEKQPLSAETYNLIGACYRHLGKYETALPFLWQALTFKPEYDLALVNLGLCCEKLGLMRAAGYYFGQEAVKNSGSDWVLECFKKFNHESTKGRKRAGKIRQRLIIKI